jgi:transposase
MKKLSTDQVKTKALDHLGLLASVIKDIGLVEKIDDLMPISKSMGAKVTMGERVAAMILNGLGFVNNRLYMFSEFLEKKPTAKLLGSHLKASDFTDDALGRCLDEIYKCGVTPLFSKLAFSIGIEQNLLGKSMHLDTTTLSVHGAYEKETEGPKLTYGFSKDHRPDLKQMVLNLATTGKAGFTMWMEAHSGNASDKKILHESAKRIKNLCEQLKEAPSFLYVSDSAM